MKEYTEVKAKRFLGQHFLKDENVASDIVEAFQPQDKCVDVLEIGPGMGVLTKYLLNRSDLNLKVIELDRDSVSYLKTNFIGLKDRIIEGDFLQMNFEDHFKNSFAIIGNFPYNISTQILFRILENKDKIPLMVGMFQKEVAERIASKPGNRDYGILIWWSFEKVAPHMQLFQNPIRLFRLE